VSRRNFRIKSAKMVKGKIIKDTSLGYKLRKRFEFEDNYDIIALD